VMGGSYGGYAVMVAVTDYPDTFAADTSLFGIVNFDVLRPEHAVFGRDYDRRVRQSEDAAAAAARPVTHPQAGQRGDAAAGDAWRE